MSVFNELKTLDHELVSVFKDRTTGLLAIIAVHDTTLGPGVGGCRFISYNNLDEALADVLNLSQAMTYKNSLCGINVGGGKSVIVAHEGITSDRDKLLESFGKAITSLNGKYYGAEDMGTTVADMSVIMKSCRYVVGRDEAIGGSGDPSPYTAQGVFDGIRACLERRFDSGDFNDRHVAIQGLGNVGARVAKLLAKAGARLTISDTRQKHLSSIASELDAQIVEPLQISTTECDVFAPCAVGGAINLDNVDALRCSIIAGAANNQIRGGRKTETRLVERGIMYAPDFAINAGGIIACADELEEGGFNPSRVKERVDTIYTVVGSILDKATETKELPGDIALRLAKERIEKARKLCS